MYFFFFGEDYKSLGEFLKSQRLNKDISQAELAEKIGVSQQSITFYESDKRIPSVKIIAPYADVLGIDTEQLYKMRTDAVLHKQMALANDPNVDLYPTPEESRAIYEKINSSNITETDDENYEVDHFDDSFKVDGKPLTEEELEKATEYIRALRIMKNQKTDNK